MRRMLCLVALLLFATSAEAARLFTSGGETQNTIQTEWNAVGGAAITFDTSTVHSGVAAMRFATASTSSATRTITTYSCATPRTFWVRVYFRVSVLPSATTDLVRVRAGGAVNVMGMALTPTGDVQVQNYTVTNTIATAATALVVDAWYRLEIRYLAADTGGQIEGRLFTAPEGMTPSVIWGIGSFAGGNGTNEDTCGTNVVQFLFGTINTATATILMDDYAINDDQGTFQNSWIGPGKIALVKPASNHTVAWTATGCATQSDCVDDVPGTPDDATTETVTATAGITDRFTMTALPAEIPANADMILVDVSARTGGTSTTGTNTMHLTAWNEAGTPFPTGAVHAGCDRVGYAVMTPDDHLVRDVGFDTKAMVNAFTYGYTSDSIDAAGSCRVTALWVNVEWIDAAAAAAAGRNLLLLGVGQ
jgi:hypothetical protein